ncbi:MAG: DUF5106 domain-containing protein [Paramuribaculum sp.]|nr:DUF5106 domain-containing protein [Paramuribaculum sp.]
MKLRTILIFSLLTVISLISRAQTTERLFPYPEIPEELVTLQDRTGYLVDHFWDRCDFNTVFSSKSRLESAFADYVVFLRHAPREKTLASLDNLLKKLEKNPDGLLYMTELAENYMYSDTAALLSDEAYLPFVKAVAQNKKISKANKLRYARQADILSTNTPGSPAPSLPYITREGVKSNLDNDSAKILVVYFNDPECGDCRMARARLNANPAANELIKNGVLKIVAITPDDATDLWRKEAESYPKTWTVAAAPDAYDLYDIRAIPSFYLIDNQHRIAAKNVTLEALVNFLNSI